MLSLAGKAYLVTYTRGRLDTLTKATRDCSYPDLKVTPGSKLYFLLHWLAAVNVRYCTAHVLVSPLCMQGVTLTNLVVTSEAETGAGPNIVRSALPLWLASFNRWVRCSELPALEGRRGPC